MNKKILHIPCNTPYVKKLQRKDDFEIVNNNKSIFSEEIKFKNILENAYNDDFWTNFDICHIHYGFELEDFETFFEAIKLIRKKIKPILYTFHESQSVHGVNLGTYKKYQDIIIEYSSKIITLTENEKLKINTDKDVKVIPHGKVIDIKIYDKDLKRAHIMFLGALRNNRDITTTLINTILGINNEDINITLLTRAFTQNQINSSESLNILINLIKSDKRVNLDLNLPLADNEFEKNVSTANILVLPYLSAGHSGQLELALDLGILPVITDVGSLEGQIDIWPKEYSHYAKQLVANWSDGKEWLYQSRLLKKIKQALIILPEFQKELNINRIKQFRNNEHNKILDEHNNIYNNLI